jgi:predicted DNA-binding protein (MmcQ/YjbR family)
VKRAERIRAALNDCALGFPGAYEDFPWGERVVKVDGKIFAFLALDKGPDYRITLKLPASRDAALSIAGAKPTAYSLGRAGWVTMPLDGTLPPLEILREWVEESYRAVAKKSRVARLTR